MNLVTLIGRMATDPELRTTSTGKQLASFRLAVNRLGKDAGADFFTVTAWEKRAEFVCNYVGKGRLVAVTGRLTTREYETTGGEKRFTVEVVASDVQTLDPKPEGAAARVAAPAEDPWADD